MPWVDSTEIPGDLRTREWWYNSLDAAVTLEISEVLLKKNSNQNVYDFERSLQGPALDMMLRGFRIDPVWRASNISRLAKEEESVQESLDQLTHAVWGKTLNPRSPDQVKDILYNVLKLPEVWLSFRGEKKLSTNREALEKLSDYYLAAPLISCIFEARDIRKKLSVCRTGVDPDGRMRCTYNVCGTETGRWASSQNVFGRGTNLQNITPELRRMFIADPGKIIVIIDGEQAESRAVGFIHGRVLDDWTYLDACEAGDLHTAVAKLVWPRLPWTGRADADREIADRAFYRHFTFRDMSKRGGHASNYNGQPWTVAKNLKVPQDLIRNFQTLYFAAFPHKAWHSWVAGQLGMYASLTTFVGRERTFYGRLNDDATLRSAIAFEPQSAVGDLVNEGGYRIWKNFPMAEPLGQYHDAWAFQIPQNRLDLVGPMKRAFEVPVTVRGRTMVIPGEAKVGWNWSDEDPKRKLFRDGNPDGLRKWKGSDTRKRTEGPETPLLDRVLY